MTERKSAYRDIALFPIHTLEYPYHISTAFPAQADSTSQISSRSGVNGDVDTSVLQTLTIVDYRYARFALDPRTGLFSMVRFVFPDNIIFNADILTRDWRDESWTGINAVKNGLSGDVKRQRLTLFGANVIDIEGKSTISLLIDEVSDYSIELNHFSETHCYTAGHSSFLRVSDSKYHPVVSRRLLLLCVLYRVDFRYQHHHNFT
jgi:hypothetical protein